jgi:Flp pilus assembly protein TadG
VDEYMMNCRAVSPGLTIAIRSLGERVRARLRASNKRGQALIEMALSLPVLLLIMTGIMTFGIALNNYLSLTNAVETGGEVLAVDRGQTTDPCADAARAIKNVSPFLNPASLSFTFSLNGNGYTGASCSSGSTTTGAAGNLVMGAPARVTATYPCNLTVYGINYAPGCTLTSQITEVVQ